MTGAPLKVSLSADARRFVAGLALIAFVALGLRAAYIVVAKSDGDACGSALCGDAFFYSNQANCLSLGKGFRRPFTGGEAADHPPLTAIVAAPASWFPGDTVTAQRSVMALVGSAAVFMIGVLGREVAGDRAGWIAAGLAAIYPNLWVNDALVMSESLTALGVAATLWLTYRMIRRPELPAAAWLGVVLGLTVLVRAELALYLPLVVVPVLWWRTGLERRERVRAVAVAVGATAAMLLPWSLYNTARFEEPVTISTNDGLTLIGANCDAVYSEEGIGLWSGRCADQVAATGDQSQRSAAYRRAAAAYIGDHLHRVPAVVSARMGRVWGLYRPAQMADYSVGEGRERSVSLLGSLAYYPLALAAVIGAVVLHRRRQVPLWPLAATAVLVTITAAALYGLTRFRVPAEVAIVVLAAVALDAGLRRWRPQPDLDGESAMASRATSVTGLG